MGGMVANSQEFLQMTAKINPFAFEFGGKCY
jgi:hypothetical protein